MRKIIRFFSGLTSTALFTGGLFVLPVVVAGLGGHILSSMDHQAPAEERVVYWEPQAGPEGEGVADGQQKAEDDADATDERDVEGAEAAADDAVADAGSSQGSAASEPAPAPAPPTTDDDLQSLTIDGSKRGRRADRGLGLRGDVDPERAAAARRRAAESGRRGGQRCETQPDHEGIASAGQREWHVERSVIDYYAGSLDRLQSLVGYVARHEDDWGKLDGARIGGIPCDSILREAGLRSGDVIHEVNGQPIKSIPGAWRAYRKLKRDDVLEVNISRRGRSLVLVYYVG